MQHILQMLASSVAVGSPVAMPLLNGSMGASYSCARVDVQQYTTTINR